MFFVETWLIEKFIEYNQLDARERKLWLYRVREVGLDMLCLDLDKRNTDCAKFP